MYKELSLEEKYARVRDMRPIDDVFFEVLASDKRVCEEILRTILENDDLVVENVIVQSSEKNLYGRSVRLDALCKMGDGTKCNIEVQRSNNDNHLKRVRFNASSITVKDSVTGQNFADIVDLYIVYISEFDFLNGGKTIYHLDKVIRETGEIVDDGLHEIFVNTVIDDGSDIADLMNCFIKKDVNNPKFPRFSSRMKELKTTDGGILAVSEIMEGYLAEARAEAIREGRAEGFSEGRFEGRTEGISIGRMEMLIGCVKDGLINISDAAKKAEMSEEDFKKLL